KNNNSTIRIIQTTDIEFNEIITIPIDDSLEGNNTFDLYKTSRILSPQEKESLNASIWGNLTKDLNVAFRNEFNENFEQLSILKIIPNFN
ncbi:unnamed protein product, partial [Brachionus calyciflorus]